MTPAEVTVELFGIPRARAGRGEVAVTAATAREALLQLGAACPALAGLLGPDGRLSPHFLLSLNGQQFVTDLDYSLRPGDRLLLLSADAGG
jgi:molybdopterin converting factor small subunit